MDSPVSFPLPPPRAVICDLDGTLVDTVPTRVEAWLATFTAFDLPAERDHVASLIGSDGKWLADRVAERAGLSLTADRAEEIDQRAGEIYSELNTNPRPLPGALAFLAALDAAGIPWAIATSSRPEQVHASVAALGLDPWPVVVDGLAVARAKPEPDLLQAAATRLGIQPADCWCVGDSRWDVLAAVAARMVPIGITSGAASISDLEKSGARAVVERPDELIPSLGPVVVGP
jgi:HAD superfamily hydrolase (TIGR01509 family)